MNSDEFAKNFYIEKLMFLKSSFQEEPKHPSAVNVKIKELELTGVQKDKLREVIDLLLDDVFYTILLGLDGESCIGNIQQTYRIYDEDNNLISDCGELESVPATILTNINMKKITFKNVCWSVTKFSLPLPYTI